MEDREIIDLYFKRSEQAIAETSLKYGKYCRKIAWNILYSDEDAEECLNDALLTVWNAIPPAKPHNLRAYLLRLVRNAAHDRYRAAHTEKRGAAQNSGSIDELAEILPDKSDVVGEVERREMLRAVTAFLESLPQRQRDLFVRRYWYATDVAALSKMFRMTQSHVTMTLSRLRKRLQKYLQKEGLL